MFSDTEHLRADRRGDRRLGRAASPARAATTSTVPRIVAVRSGARFAGGDWIGLRPSDSADRARRLRLPLALGLLGLLLLVGATVATWVTEGRRSA